MSEVTRILSAIDQGDARAAGQLLPLVYEELRRLAAQKLAQDLGSRPAIRPLQWRQRALAYKDTMVMAYLIIAYVLSAFTFVFGIIFIIRRRTPFTTSEGPPSFRTTNWYSVQGGWARVIGFIWLIPLLAVILCHFFIAGELLAATIWALIAGVCLLVHKVIGWSVGR